MAKNVLESDAAASTPTRKTKIRIIIAIAAIMFVSVAGFLAYDYGYFQSSPPVGSYGSGQSLMQATCASLSNSTSAVEGMVSRGNASHVYFLIVAADPPSPYAGFNGSYYHAASSQWPVMHVHKGQIVSFRVLNCASSEPHGFAITHYDDQSIITIRTGQSYEVTFTADQTGTFRVYCDIFCAIHPLMQNGELIVS